ncbi:hypothetical protein BAUCODRAFT_39634 [Baudoinia panamericana UAMH 10762]|uniref:Uncharacterized protein n=1 Tax=Baudoinia panamericana (strain UAMH 10762) TaxID=717646 RepID=M2MXQ4_BAUPA|nr:uncharacterized protein BAUCODRAFT_39634 [Baudoinia panamericana UAMH 10762]EMC91449.1 hypothetical protein BAUCODRAFT_39634 [Baudoinia panamericana UAMH 10762]
MTKLTKPRTNDSGLTKPTESPRAPSFELPLRTSYEKLRQPEARQLLREQLLGTFPETIKGQSQESVTTTTMLLGQRFSRRRSSTLEVGVNASAQSSSSTLDSVGPKRLSAVPEKKDQAIDIEQAISLLQELKKTASPEELVALHRALLPTKDVETVTSPRILDADKQMTFPTPPPAQRRSVLPPGFATRGGPTEDILRKPSQTFNETQKVRNNRESAWAQPTISHQKSTSLSSIAALDLADDSSHHHSRVITPSDMPYAFAGAYRPGTLRITNGAASPEPSIRTPMGIVPCNEVDAKAEEGYFTSSEGRPSVELPRGRASMDVVRAQPSHEIITVRASVDVVRPKPSQESITIRERILSSDKALQQRKDRAQRVSTISALSEESLVSRTGLALNTKVSKQSIDRDSVSPASDAPAPRWAQRQSHRASHLSGEFTPESVVAAAAIPPEEKSSALREFALRLSTVYDSDADDMEGLERGTPAAALSKLTGEGDVKVETTKASAEIPEIHSEEHEQLPWPMRPSPPHKVDSGYGSDVTLRKGRTSFDEQRTSPPPLRTPKRNLLAEVNEQDEQAETASIAASVAKSLYSFEDILASPSLLTDLRPSLRTAAPSTLPLHTMKADRTTSLQAVMNSDYVSTEVIPQLDSLGSSPADPKKGQQTVKQHRKLQKPMPASVKKQRRDQRQKLKASHAVELPAGDDGFPAAHQQSRQFSGDSSRSFSAPSLPPFEPPSPLVFDDRELGASAPTVDARARAEPLGWADSILIAEPAPPIPAESAVEVLPEPEMEPVPDLLQQSETQSAPDGAPEPVEQAPAAVVESLPLSRCRSRSRSRGRENSIRHDVSADETPEAQRGWSIAKLRGKSGSRTRSKASKRSSLDVMLGNVMLGKPVEQKGDKGDVSPGDENVPAWTDFSSVARTLGSGSYDIATNQVQRATSTLPSAAAHQLQSPYMISTGLVKGKAVRGMDSEAASELARMKSRDIARQEKEQFEARPRVATPTSGRSRSKGRASPRSSISVEDRFPDWQQKTNSQPSTPQQSPALNRRHSMYAESIPPLPELPADVAEKASRADLMVAKKLKDSANSSPSGSANASAEDLQQTPVRPQLTKRISQYKAHQEIIIPESAGVEVLHPVEREGVKYAAEVSVMVRELSGSGSEQSISTTTAEKEDVQVVQSPTHDAQHPGWPGWEQQAKAWRQRRESIGAALGKPIDTASIISAEFPPGSRKPSETVPCYTTQLTKSPSIVVSRYITPLAAENAARANARDRPTDAAAQHANGYRDLIVDDKENRPAKQDVPRTDSAVTTASTSTFVTVKSWDPRPIKQDVPRSSTAYSTQTYATVTTTTSTISRSRSPGGHVRTPSGNFIPYAPSKAPLAEHSRAQSLAKLNDEASASVPSLVQSTTYTHQSNKSNDSLGDRYSGGLGYGWERGAGFVGSAGTRTGGDGGRRKSKKMSQDFGLDLSDVPVFLQKLQ